MFFETSRSSDRGSMAMKWKMVVSALLVIVLAIGVYRSFYGGRTPQSLQAYSQVLGNMTVEDVRNEMGRAEDPPDKRKTATGEFERSWTFEDGVRCTVVFNKDGRSTYKEIAPHYCGVTPLQDKYIEDGMD